MKRIIITIGIAASATLLTYAQSDVTFAERLGANQYYGTARTMGMGNAVTAVGGDLGTIGINPAGSAVFNYGQVEISPGLSITAGQPQARFALPSAGFSLCFDTGRREGLRNVTFSFVNNVTNNYLESWNASYQSDGTSFFANAAAAAKGIRSADLASAYAYDYPDLDWALISAYQGKMMGGYGIDGVYLANNELLAEKDGQTYHYVPGTLNQFSEIKRYGTKNDMVFNLAFNLSDRFYFGFNLGVPIIRYNYGEVFTESPVDREQFPIVFKTSTGQEYTALFNSAKYGYSYASTTVGVYAKAGLLWRPLDFLRIGAAIQTPVAYGISERYANNVSSLFVGDEGSVRGSASSPRGSYDYNFRGPWRFNVGMTWTIGPWALLSADYEMAAFGRTRYSEKSRYAGEDYFSDSNKAISLFLGRQHALRLGAEVRPLPGFAIRAGYTLTGSPERIYTDNLGQSVDVYEYYADWNAFDTGLRTLKGFRYKDSPTWSASFGLGWSSQGSIFVDAAVRFNSFPTYTYFPYLYGDYAAVDKDNRPLPDASSPRLSINMGLWDLTVTVGWRF